MAKRKTQKTGVMRVYDNAEMSTNFPKNRKLVKVYKLTVYNDGRVAKSELKTAVKKARKVARKGASRKRGKRSK